MNILVTGSSGFIARFMIPELAAQGHAVAGIDKRKGPVFGDYFRFVHGNILDEQAVDAAMQRTDVVIHLAAEHKDFGVPAGLYHQVNVDGTELLLQCASRLGINKFMFFSSVAVYGDRSTPTDEMMTPAPVSPYGESKLRAEERIQIWAAEDRCRSATIVRPAVIFGPHNYANMYRLIRSVSRHRYVSVGNGENIKSVGYVENIAAAAIFLMHRMLPGVDIYNFADTPHMATRDLVARIAKHLNVGLPPVRIPKSLALACVYPLDIIAKVTGIDLPLTAKRIDKFTRPTHHQADKIIAAGFVPPHSLDTAIARTAAWFQADQDAPPEAT